MLPEIIRLMYRFPFYWESQAKDSFAGGMDLKSEISPIALTIQDFIGAILPGMVWAIEFFTFRDVVTVLAKGIGQPEPLMYPSTFDVALSLVRNPDNTIMFYIGFAVCSLIIGYISNAFPTNVAEKITVVIWHLAPWLKSHCMIFPYNRDFLSNKAIFFEKIQSYFRNRFNVDIENINGNNETSCKDMADSNCKKKADFVKDDEIFQQCKKLVKCVAPDHVRERVMYYESQCRMLSSMLLTSIANVLLLVPAIFISSGANRISILGILFFSVCTVIVLAYTFHYRRHSEVYSIYTYTHLAISLSVPQKGRKLASSLFQEYTQGGRP